MTDTGTNFWDFLKGVSAAAGPLFGAWIALHYQAKQTAKIALRERNDKLADEQAQRDRVDDKLCTDRAYARSLLARHLEAFARKCADVMWENTNPEHDNVQDVPRLPEWPDVPWELLGADEMMKTRDIAVHVDMHREVVEGNAYWGASGPDDERRYRADGAAIVGYQAWNIAVRMREDADVAPFAFPEGPTNFAEALAEHVHDREEQRIIADERRAANPDS